MTLWTIEHTRTLLPAIAVMICTGALLRYFLKHKPLDVRMIPFQILACIGVVLEIIKQITSFSRGYDLYHIPLHFCSLFIFALPIMSFYKGKHRRIVSAITASLCSALFLMMLIYPNLIYSAYDITNFFGDFMNFHTVAFHNLVMLEYILIIFLDLHTPDNKRDPKAAMIFITGYSAVAATMAQLLKTNYANFYSCNIPPLEAIRLSLQPVLGVAFTQLLYVLIVTTLHILFVCLAYWVYRLAARPFSIKSAGTEECV